MKSWLNPAGRVPLWPLTTLAVACAFVLSATARAEPPTRVVQASWYGAEFRNRRTASGERFDPESLTGAHRTLPLGSRLKVTNLRNGRSVLIMITDRGPFRKNRDLDLSLGAARMLDMVERGVERVRIEPTI